MVIRTIRFDRTVHIDHAGEPIPAALPLAPASSGSAADFDWSRTGAATFTQAVACPRTIPALTVTVGLDVTTPLTTDVLVRAKSQSSQALGNVAEFTVPKDTVGPFEATRTVDTGQLAQSPVGRTSLSWDWQRSDDGGTTWVGFDTTVHTVYVLLAEPAFPWGRPGDNTRVAPWTDAVDTACDLAATAGNHEEAARLITKRIFGLGRQRIVDMQGNIRRIGWQSSPAYQAGLAFKCSEFIDLIRLKRTNEYRINCKDCAAAVTTFATVLGVKLGLLMLAPEGDLLLLRPIWLLGNGSAAATEFSLHFVAGRNDGSGRRIWDACVMLDFDPGQPFDWVVPAGVTLDELGTELDYLGRFLAMNEPSPDVSERPLRYPDRVPPQPLISPEPERAERREQFRSLMAAWAPKPPIGRIEGLDLLRLLSADAATVVQRTVSVGDTTEVELTASYRAAADPAASLRLSVLATGGLESALEAYLDVLGDHTTPLTPVPGLADFAFYCPADESVVALRGSVVITLRNDPDRAVPIRTEMRRLDDALTQPPP